MRVRVLFAVVSLLAALAIVTGCVPKPIAQVEQSAPATRPTSIEHRVMRPVFPSVDSRSEPMESPPCAESGKRGASQMSVAFEDAARRVLPAVVTIHRVSKPDKPKPRSGKTDPDPEELLRRFFGQPSGKQGHQSLASGLIVHPSGLILTNEHVVHGEATVTVELRDGREFQPADIKTDPRSDLALLRIDGAGPLPAAVLGDSDRMDIGDWVLAVGSPFGLDATVTAGIISAKGRGLGSTLRQEFLQTDAAINPGNSGGPLVNIRGEVVGINAAIETTSGGYQGVGFAIPINLVKWVGSQLVERGAVRRGYLGVSVQELSPDLSAKLRIQSRRGVVVAEVRPNSPAATAGVRPGDVITQFAGRPMANGSRLSSAVERVPLDSQQDLRVVREGQPLDLRITVREEPKNYGIPRAPRADGNEEPEQTMAE
jgi:serine protease Do